MHLIGSLVGTINPLDHFLTSSVLLWLFIFSINHLFFVYFSAIMLCNIVYLSLYNNTYFAFLDIPCLLPSLFRRPSEVLRKQVGIVTILSLLYLLLRSQPFVIALEKTRHPQILTLCLTLLNHLHPSHPPHTSLSSRLLI